MAAGSANTSITIRDFMKDISATVPLRCDEYVTYL
jgi:hypothetical protein